MFLDFNGLPGCGKSTVSADLVRKLQNEGRPAMLFQQYIDRHISSVPGSLWFFVRGLAGMSPVRLAVFVRFCRSLPREAPRKPYRLYLLLLNYFLYRRSVRDNPGMVIVSEQCVIQEIISCYYDQAISPEDSAVDRVLELLGDDYRAVNAVLSPEAALERLAGRENGESRLDTVHDKATTARILRVQAENLNLVRQAMNRRGMRTAEIRMENPPEENADRIIEFLEAGGEKP